MKVPIPIPASTPTSLVVSGELPGPKAEASAEYSAMDCAGEPSPFAINNVLPSALGTGRHAPIGASSSISEGSQQEGLHMPLRRNYGDMAVTLAGTLFSDPKLASLSTSIPTGAISPHWRIHRPLVLQVLPARTSLLRILKD